MPAAPLAAALSDRYLIERELGRGGMATIYLARDLKHDRFVALKVLHAELAATLGPDRTSPSPSFGRRSICTPIFQLHICNSAGVISRKVWRLRP
jgi:serine/threonine protein kinase